MYPARDIAKFFTVDQPGSLAAAALAQRLAESAGTKRERRHDAGCGGMRCKRTENCQKGPEAAREDASYPNTANRACKAALWVVVASKSCGNASGRLL